jgi:hypothetical protein
LEFDGNPLTNAVKVFFSEGERLSQTVFTVPCTSFGNFAITESITGLSIASLPKLSKA